MASESKRKVWSEESMVAATSSVFFIYNNSALDMHGHTSSHGLKISVPYIYTKTQTILVAILCC